MKIVKAEILFSRQCKLNCSYCGMKNSKENTRTISEWKAGIDNLKLLGCEFIAFYGAEPLMEIDKLIHVVGYAESIGIDTTVITSGAVPHFEDSLRMLHTFGARSLSMSFDPLPMDSSSYNKSMKALQYLKLFKSWKNVRDVAAIATLTTENYLKFPEMVKEMSQYGIWSFFDFIHTDRGQPGTKCSHADESLLFKAEHTMNLAKMLGIVLNLKSKGYLCHTTEHFIQTILDTEKETGSIYNWTCSNQAPSWVTIDCDGSVHPCDDFMLDDQSVDMCSLYKRWDEIRYTFPEIVDYHKCKCCWNTHIDAHGIMAGKVNINEYVHGRE